MDGFEAMSRESAMREMAPEVSTQPLRGSLAEFSEDGAAGGESRSSRLAPLIIFLQREIDRLPAALIFDQPKFTLVAGRP
jgi:hypothetical protein